MDLEPLSREELIALLQQAFATIEALQAEVASLKEEIKRLQGGPPAKPKPTVPDFVKPNAPKPQQTPRKKRPHGYSRKRQDPTEVVPHYPSACSGCGRKLSGGWLHRVREVIELPATAVKIVHHHVMACHCGVCNRREVASLDLGEEVVGRSRLGVRLMSLIAYLDTVCRMPVRLIKRLLSGLFGLSLSLGQISLVLQQVAQKGEAAYQNLISQMRASPVVHADETGWRQNGQNGYVWSFSTPSVRVYTGHEGRSGEVARRMLGADFANVLVTDFYGGYHWYNGRHQYCWVHLLRDLHKLCEQYPDNADVKAFSVGVKEIYQQATEYSHSDVWARQRQRRTYQTRLLALARAHQGADRKERVLAQRLLKHVWGLFVFVENPAVPAHNNAAERAIRPLVVVRKVSGGSRSETGTKTVATLMSLFGTWQVRGADLLQQCQLMLQTNPKPQHT